MFRGRLSLTALVSVFVACLIAAQLAQSTPAFAAMELGKREVKIGREAVRDFEKHAKILDDPKLIERVERLGKAIAEVANKEEVPAGYGSPQVTEFEYKFKIIDDSSVNAFSLPGGYIYVNKGLLDRIQSDHELAGVLAHEVAHAAHHHMVYLLKEQSKMDNKIMLLLIAGVLGGVDSSSLGNIIVGAQMLRIAKASGYGQRAEMDADAAAVAYVTKAGYNPVGVLTFMERLAQESATTPGVEMGIMQTHPAARDRCRDVRSRIEACGLPINRRAVTDALKAVVVPGEVNGKSVSQVMLRGRIIFNPAPVENVLTSDERARYIATRINQFLDTEPAMREVKLSKDGRTIHGEGEPIIAVIDEDSTLCGKDASEIAGEALENLKCAMWSENLASLY